MLADSSGATRKLAAAERKEMKGAEKMSRERKLGRFCGRIRHTHTHLGQFRETVQGAINKHP